LNRKYLCCIIFIWEALSRFLLDPRALVLVAQVDLTDFAVLGSLAVQVDSTDFAALD
jgi:hypothetical protein